LTFKKYISFDCVVFFASYFIILKIVRGVYQRIIDLTVDVLP